MFCRSALEQTLNSLQAKLQEQSAQVEAAAGVHAELKQQQQDKGQVQSQLLEQQQRNDGLQREADLAHIQLQESREAFRVRIQHCALEVQMLLPVPFVTAPLLL